MTIRVPNLRLELNEVPDAPKRLARRAASVLGTRPECIESLTVVRRSLDARGRNEPHFVVTVEVEVEGASGAGATPAGSGTGWRPGRRVLAEPPPVIVGAGPAGLFAALALVEAGVAPLILERGRPVELRKLDVARLYREGLLDPDSNVSFGEGGAGTFTDGKLSTNNRARDNRRVLELLVELGKADSDILVSSKPHLGSELLPRIVTRLRERLIEAGCRIRFDARVENLIVIDGVARGLLLAGGEEIEARSIILAPGNAARELFSRLAAHRGLIIQKPMAVGLRIEHPQELIDRIQYGRAAGSPFLPPAEYSLATRAQGRGLWTFCMCPGGVVVPTPTEAGGLCVNGMSSSRRAGRFANAAVVVEVGPSDYDEHSGGVLAGVAFQRSLEQAAFEAGGGAFRAPAQRLTEFLSGRTGASLPPTSYPRGLTAADLSRLLGPRLTVTLREGLAGLGRRMPGFVTEEAVLIGVETRTSSPVAIAREASGESPVVPGLFPCGEGCGHGGGIVSAAADGLKVGRHLGAILAAS